MYTYEYSELHFVAQPHTSFKQAIDLLLIQATLATLGAGPDCVIFSDELNHASIIDGIRLAKASGATLRVYRSHHLHAYTSPLYTPLSWTPLLLALSLS